MWWVVIIILCISINFPLFAKDKSESCIKDIESVLRELNSPENKVAGKAAQNILKCADELNVGIVRLAVFVCGRVED